MTAADFLTILRVGLTPLIMILWVSPSPSLRWLGLALFVIAGMTDFFDGMVARRSHRTTKLGSYLDPLADKILVLGTGLALVAAHRLDLWLIFVVLLRELAITGLRSVLQSGTHMPASYAAKWKTTGQLFALGASSVLTGWVPAVFWTIAVILTVWTAVEYFAQHWAHIE